MLDKEPLKQSKVPLKALFLPLPGWFAEDGFLYHLQYHVGVNEI